ncbi:Sulfotransferase family protein [Microbulbifer donghaiensis]|uniref:Sulfotransferase family protein n=1 Tax=Microbulbifer donghaiensis TaxID=494016 RepID=A0A1M5CJX8_9GAMM|nr:sulfotransferase family 2 domain-containing protein [Microbulbifer donghaiensis]SHF55054.1 Sulfotransferase family protein [Microbulbifer donghaiensis]
MKPFVFIHIPKTAGTSFRYGADAFFGPERICRDYGPESPETSEIVNHWVTKVPDGWRFKKAFENEGYLLLTGHFHAVRYAPIFGIRRMVTFLRDPIQRTISEFRHFVRHNGFTGDFEAFYRAKQNINRQRRILDHLPWPALGFLGFTEHYQESLALLNHKFGLQIPALSENLSRDSYTEPYEVTAEQEAELRRLNAAEIRFYNLAKEQFEWRRRLFERQEPFVAGTLMRAGDKNLDGWAVADEGDDPVTVQARVNGEVIAEAVANQDRPGLREKGVARGGFVGFSFDISHLKPGDLVECVVASSGQSLVRSPWKIQSPS